MSVWGPEARRRGGEIISHDAGRAEEENFPEVCPRAAGWQAGARDRRCGFTSCDGCFPGRLFVGPPHSIETTLIPLSRAGFMALK